MNKKSFCRYYSLFKAERPNGRGRAGAHVFSLFVQIHKERQDSRAGKFDKPVFSSNPSLIFRKGGNNAPNHIYTSGYRGVYSRSGKWNAQIQYNGKKVVGSPSSHRMTL